MLGCDADPDVPCRGFQGYCADLKDQFTGVQDDMLPRGLTCRRFPDDGSEDGAEVGVMRRDSVLVGLISAAVALPFSLVVLHCFEARAMLRMLWL